MTKRLVSLLAAALVCATASARSLFGTVGKGADAPLRIEDL